MRLSSPLEPPNQLNLVQIPKLGGNKMFESAIREYLNALRQGGKSDATRRNYGWHLRKLVEWLADQQVDRPDEVSRALLREWGAGLFDHWSPATIKQAVCAARSFFAWCYEEEIIAANVGQALKVPKVKKRIQRTLSAKEIQALLNACDTNTVKGLRDQALVSLMVDSGLRADETCRLRVADVDLEVNLLVVNEKGGDEEYGTFSYITAGYLHAWLEVRPEMSGVDALFVSIGGITPRHPLTTRGLRIIVKKLGEKAGVLGVSPHTLRRAFACIATEAGASFQALTMLGRWEDIRMVKRYTRALKVAKLYPLYSPMVYIERTEGRLRQLPLFDL
jgi:integrase/recombinase XerD